MSNIKNPWKGLSTYTVDDNDDFVGREKDIRELCCLIENNLITTLYGKSGIGKSSLLNAGVTPELNLAGYMTLHINIRDVKNADLDFKSQIAKNLLDLLRINDGCDGINTLWEILHLKYLEGNNVYPIIIFDQFEELFSGVAEEDVYDFISQIAELKLGRSKTTENHNTEFTENNNFRIVLSMREDDLYRLEDCIDKHGFYSLKDNRFRLRSLSVDGVRSVVKLGESFFDDIERCSDAIWEQLKDNNGNVDSATLSLLCYRLFNKARHRTTITITEKDVLDEKDSLYNLYKEEMSSLKRNEQSYIEKNLITSSGRRDIISTEQFKKHISNADALLINSAEHFSLFRLIDNGKNVEFIHDSLARAVYKNKENRHNNVEKYIQILRSLSVAISCFFIPFIPFIYVLLSWIHDNSKTTGHFYTKPYYTWVILFTPILSCIFIGKIKKFNFPFIVICLLMANINKLGGKYLEGNHYVISQGLLYVLFLVYSIYFFRPVNKTSTIFKVTYINIVTFVCLIFGFGFNPFIVKNVVSSKLSIPWSYALIKQNDKLGYVDWNGRQVLPCVFDSISEDGYYLSKHVRTLYLKNENLKEIHNSCHFIYPVSYKDGEMRCYLFPQLENQRKNFMSDYATEECRLVAQIIDESRRITIDNLLYNNPLYSNNLVRNIKKLFDIQKDSLYNFSDSLKKTNAIISDETIKNLRIKICKCICTLHMLESFGKKGKINDDDVFYSILSLEYFSLFELIDEKVGGYQAAICIKTSFGGIIPNDSSKFEISGFAQQNKREVYYAFKALCLLDMGIHFDELIGFLDQTYNKLSKQNSDLQNVLKHLSSINSEGSNDKSTLPQKNQNYAKKINSILDTPVFQYNDDVFDYRKVIEPLITCISINEIPDQSAALTYMANRLIIMGMLRGMDMHHYIEELDKAYYHSTLDVMSDLYDTVLKVDSLETEFKKSTEYQKIFKIIGKP